MVLVFVALSIAVLSTKVVSKLNTLNVRKKSEKIMFTLVITIT